MSDSLTNLLERGRLLVSCGPGGVGKTTTAAALALHAARLGRRALVLTIDPARRLATCLGLDALAWHPTRVPLPEAPGQLWAMMLDTRQTFDDLVRRLAPDLETANDILDSRLYGIFAGSMHGTPEYMALESLHNVYFDARFDLVVLDTPPLTDAISFFKTPHRASWIFDERILRWFVPSRQPRGLRARFHPGSMVLKLLGVLAGPTLVADIAEFFGALDLIRDALKQRGDEVARVLRDGDTHYLVVTSPDDRRIDESLELARQLREMRADVRLFLVNRSHHHLVGEDGALASAQLGFEASPADLEILNAIGRRFAASGRRHQREIARLEQTVGGDRVLPIPELEEEVVDLAGLTRLAAHLVTPDGG